MLEWELELHPDSQALPNLSLWTDMFHSPLKAVVPNFYDIFIPEFQGRSEAREAQFIHFNADFSLYSTYDSIAL